MCVIIHKPAGVQIPDVATLWLCWEANPDGAGLSYYRPDRPVVGVQKGYMSWAEFEKALPALKPEDDVVLHFRVATSGGVNPEMTHPFIVSTQKNMLRCTKGVSRFVMAHNGVLGSGKDGLSDTALFVRDKLAPTLSLTRDIEADTVTELMDVHTTSNRFVLQDGQNHVTRRFGSWHERDGCYFSNTYWAWDYRPSKKGKSVMLADDCGLVCPVCDGKVKCISDHWGLYECQRCGDLTDVSGRGITLIYTDEVWDDGEGFTWPNS